jgi:hypothetical protein
MLDAGNRAQRCRDLAEECRRLAAIGPPTEIRTRYLRMAEALLHAAEAEEPSNPTQEIQHRPQRCF